MTVKSTELIRYMETLQSITPRWETVKTRLSRNAFVLYNRMSFDGKFSDFLITRKYKTGRIHLMKVR